MQLTISTGTPTPSSTPSASASASSSPTATDTGSTDSGSDSAKRTAIIGGVVGGVVGGLAGIALIIALVWMLKRRRRKQAVGATVLPDGAQDTAPGTTVPAHEYKGAFGELPDTHVRSELSGSPNGMAHELPAETSR